MIFLDSDIMIDIIREYSPALVWLVSLEDEELILPGFVVMELLQGYQNKKQQQKIENILVSYTVRWPSSSVCDKALSLFASLHLEHGLGVLDALIAQTAISLELPIPTFNEKHYKAIPNLKIIRPYKKPHE